MIFNHIRRHSLRAYIVAQGIVHRAKLTRFLKSQGFYVMYGALRVRKLGQLGFSPLRQETVVSSGGRRQDGYGGVRAQVVQAVVVWP